MVDPPRGSLARLCAAGVVIAAGVFGAIMHVTPSDTGWPTDLQGLTRTIAFTLTGVYLLRFAKARIVGATLFSGGILSGINLLAIGLAFVLDDTWADVADILKTVAFITDSLALYVSWAVLPQVFPAGLLPGRRWWRAFWVPIWVLIGTFMFLGVFDTLGFDEFGWYLYVAAFVGAAVVGVISLVVRWRRGPHLVRQQVGLFLGAMVIGLVILLLAVTGAVSSTVADLLFAMLPILVVVAIASAVLQHQLFDIRVVVRRAAVYGMLAVGLATVFVAVYAVALAALSERVTDERYQLAAIVVALAVVVASEPLHRRARVWLEQRLVGERSDPLTALARLRGTSDGSDDTSLFDTVVDAVAAAVRSPGVRLAIQHEAGLRTLAETGEATEDGLRFPLVHRGELLGELRVVPRAPGETYSKADKALLRQMVEQTSTLLYGRRRDAELAELRREALESTLAERSRLGRDLHDGLAPLLAGAGLSAEALRQALPVGSTDEGAAARLASRLRAAAGEVRRLAHDLQPTVLDEGLTTAVASHLEALNDADPVFTFEAELGPLPAAVEQTAYLVILEAVNNVVRHAHAQHALVQLTTDDTDLRLLVEDDGIGLHHPYISGIGMKSMRSRVVGLGGRFLIEATPAGGTVVRVQLPLRHSVAGGVDTP